MHLDIVVSRLLHIVFGVFWAGSLWFVVVILEPRLRPLGPAVQRQVLGTLGPIVAPVMAASATVTIGAGVYLALRLRWGRLDTFLDTAWGWALLVSFVASMIAYIFGFDTLVTRARMGRLQRAIVGRPPDPEEVVRMQRFADRIALLNRIDAVLVLIAVGAMATARFV